MKVVGRIGGELVAIEGRLRDSGWALVMPETPEAGTASPPVATPLVNMMKWVTGMSSTAPSQSHGEMLADLIAVHDVFGLYGRPGRYNWDERDPKSLFFAYPRGSERNVSRGSSPRPGRANDTASVPRARRCPRRRSPGRKLASDPKSPGCHLEEEARTDCSALSITAEATGSTIQRKQSDRPSTSRARLPSPTLIV